MNEQNKIELIKKLNSKKTTLLERYKELLEFVKNNDNYDREIYKLFIRAEREVKKQKKEL